MDKKFDNDKDEDMETEELSDSVDPYGNFDDIEDYEDGELELYPTSDLEIDEDD